MYGEHHLNQPLKSSTLCVVNTLAQSHNTISHRTLHKHPVMTRRCGLKWNTVTRKSRMKHLEYAKHFLNPLNDSLPTYYYRYSLFLAQHTAHAEHCTTHQPYPPHSCTPHIINILRMVSLTGFTATLHKAYKRTKTQHSCAQVSPAHHTSYLQAAQSGVHD